MVQMLSCVVTIKPSRLKELKPQTGDFLKQFGEESHDLGEYEEPVLARDDLKKLKEEQE